jgi:tRNA (uracil-5-)-methyltransferase
MKFGDLIQGTIMRFDAKGRGVFDLERTDAPPRPCAVPFTTIGDTVEARFIKRDGPMIVADLARVITPGPDRMDIAPALDRYPGGVWMPMRYDAQVRCKRDLINAAFAEAGHKERVDAVIPSSVLTHFRNRMDYAVSWDGKIGLKEFGSWNRYRDITEDPLLSSTTPAILEVFRRVLNSGELRPWDNVKYHGDLRYVVIREGKNTGDRLIAPIVHDLSRVTETTKDLLRRELSALCTSLVIGENPLVTDLSVAQNSEVLIGDGTLHETINDTNYRIHLNSFFQTNSVMAATLQDVVTECVAEAGYPVLHLLDLYCGLGFFGINLAKRHTQMHVSGFEIDAQAIALANENAQTNDVADTCDFLSGPAEDLSWKDIAADVVILDPPRAGLHPRVIAALLEKKPRTIIYVSCNYHRLVQELTQFKTAYHVQSLQAVDMFPHTPHVEVVTRLSLT